jgi:hypothetical protein
MRRVTATLFLVGGLAFSLFASTAGADPANSLIATFSFACTNGLTFDAVGISQNRNTTGHIVSANDPTLSLNAIFQVKRITVNGQVVKDISGFDGRSLLSCQIVAIDGQTLPPGSDIVDFIGYFTPASSN